MLDLRPDHIAIVCNIAGTEIPQASIWCFGSRARGDHRETSDLDLLLRAAEPIPIRTLSRVQQLFETSYLPFRVDLVDWHRIDSSFRQAIETQQVKIQDAKSWVSDQRFEPWHAVPLAECAAFVAGDDSPRRRPPSNNSIPWVRPEDLSRSRLSQSTQHISLDQQAYSIRQAPPGTLLLQIRGPGLTEKLPFAIADINVAWSRDLRALIPKEVISSAFLAAALNQFTSALLSLAQNGSEGTPQLNIQALEAFPIPLPPLNEQNLLTAFLDRLEETSEQDLLKPKKPLWIGTLSRGTSPPQGSGLHLALRSHLIRGEVRLLSDGSSR